MRKAKRPLISVIVPTLNEEKYIGKCLESIKKQTLKDFEIIVVDGESTDRTVEIAKRFETKIMFSKGNAASARNEGAQNSEGSILLFVDADVILKDTNIFKKIKRILEDEKIGAVVCSPDPYLQNENSFVTETFYKLFFSFGNFFSQISLKTKRLCVLMPGFCLFVKKSLFQKVGGFEEDLSFYEDADLVLKLQKNSDVVFLAGEVFSSVRRYSKLGFPKANLYYFVSTLNSFFYKLRLKRTKPKLEPVR
ncbi:MAG: glycosyltransferase [Candidatus Aenigmarchaeota archaeon]|nr:glycosyltransferase [Candidatus Aenigmarchaeota archaeon]